jgi:hypothetical protein
MLLAASSSREGRDALHAHGFHPAREHLPLQLYLRERKLRAKFGEALKAARVSKVRYDFATDFTSVSVVRGGGAPMALTEEELAAVDAVCVARDKARAAAVARGNRRTD